VFPDVVPALLLPLVAKRVGSTDWQEREVAILSLGATRDGFLQNASCTFSPFLAA
jgi:hypothetical protein